MEKYFTLGFLCQRLNAALEHSFARILEEQGWKITPAQFSVLHCLQYNEFQSQYHIAKVLNRDAAGIKRIIDKLEQNGLAERKYVSNIKNAIVLTDKGREVLPELKKLSYVALGRALAGINLNELDITMDLLSRAYNNLTKQQ